MPERREVSSLVRHGTSSPPVWSMPVEVRTPPGSVSQCDMGPPKRRGAGVIPNRRQGGTVANLPRGSREACCAGDEAAREENYAVGVRPWSALHSRGPFRGSARPVMIRQRLRPLTPQLSGLVACCLLGAMGLIMLGSAWEDALTMDEPIHLIGVRHLLPVFPFTIILVSRTIGWGINPLPGTADGPIPGVEHGGGRRPPLAGDQRAAHVPSFLAYFHAAVGEPVGEGGALCRRFQPGLGARFTAAAGVCRRAPHGADRGGRLWRRLADL
jgi:hypothetical protein